MINKILFLFSVSLIACGCKITSAQKDDRKTLIAEFINSVENYDTLKLFTIIDTTEYFDVQDKASFLNQVMQIKMRIEECGKKVLDRDIKIHHRDIPFTDYTYSFCRGSRGEITKNSFDIQFTFADFDYKGKIHYLEVQMSKKNVAPTKPPSDL